MPRATLGSSLILILFKTRIAIHYSRMGPTHVWTSCSQQCPATLPLLLPAIPHASSWATIAKRRFQLLEGVEAERIWLATDSQMEDRIEKPVRPGVVTRGLRRRRNGWTSRLDGKSQFLHARLNTHPTLVPLICYVRGSQYSNESVKPKSRRQRLARCPTALLHTEVG
jgi:hypothetical protein